MNVQQSMKRVLELNDHILEAIEERDRSYSRLTHNEAKKLITEMQKEIHDIGDKFITYESTTH